jgi:hypothetical protein
MAPDFGAWDIGPAILKMFREFSQALQERSAKVTTLSNRIVPQALCS